ncbi:MAG: single-stranded-DNA-specific exonuclease RecJ [Bdellovibrionales bacterium]
MDIPKETIDTNRPGNIPPIVWRLMQKRQIDSDEIRNKILSASLKELRSPFLLDDMDKAVDRIHQAYLKQERICIYGDFDLDGTSATALLLDAFERLGFKYLEYYQPKRISEGYGFHNHAVDTLKEKGVSLIITVDVGITAVETVEYAKKSGVDVIITDHHLPKDKLPEAVAVVNPNKGVCTSGLGHLCGAGVAYYLALAVRKYFIDHKVTESTFKPKELLDLFVIGTFTDMVPIIDENRILCKHGLIQFQNTVRPGLKCLMKALKYNGKSISGQDLAIGIAPKLNALSRLEMGLLPIDVLLAKTDAEADAVIDKVLNLNSLRKKLQHEAELSADTLYHDSKSKNFAFVWSDTYHKGIVGLVATRLSQNYKIPAFVGACDVDGKIVGSARAPEGGGLSLPEILEHGKEHLIGFGGHAAAAGFSLKKENAEVFLESLRLALVDFNPESITTVGLNSSAYFDTEADISEINPEVMKWFDYLGPFGQDFPVPSFSFKNIFVRGIKKLNGGHLKFKMASNINPNFSIDALYFSPPKNLPEISVNQGVNVVGEVQWNYFAGRKNLQMLIRDIEVL